MYRYKKIMVALNLDEHDSLLIKYAGFISKLAKSEEICFVHVSDTFKIPEEIKKVYPEVITPVDQAAVKQMEKVVNKHLNGYDKTINRFEIYEGQLLGNLLTCLSKHDIDLLITGHYTKFPHSGVSLSEKLARIACCSVLVIPDDAQIRFDGVLVAVDFSDLSRDALDVGAVFAKASNQKYVNVINTYDVPEGFYKTGKSYEEFAQIMEKNAEDRLGKLLNRIDLKGIKTRPVFRLGQNVVENILKHADEIDSNLIVVGARGRSGDLAAILLGSITEGLIRKLHKPLLAVKEKGAVLNILEALSL